MSLICLRSMYSFKNWSGYVNLSVAFLLKLVTSLHFILHILPHVSLLLLFSLFSALKFLLSFIEIIFVWRMTKTETHVHEVCIYYHCLVIYQHITGTIKGVFVNFQFVTGTVFVRKNIFSIHQCQILTFAKRY